MSEYPKITVHVSENGRLPRVFIDNDELPFEVYTVSASDGFGEPSVTLKLPASAVEFKRVD